SEGCFDSAGSFVRKPGPGRREDPAMDSLVSGSAAARNGAATRVDMQTALTYCLLKIPGKKRESIEFFAFYFRRSRHSPCLSPATASRREARRIAPDALIG